MTSINHEVAKALEFNVDRDDFGFVPVSLGKALISATLDLLKECGLPSDHPAMLKAGAAINAIADDLDDVPPRHLIRAILSDSLDEGELELDDAFGVSQGQDNGAYVQTWSWVSFEGTPLDKKDPEYGLTKEQFQFVEAFFVYVIKKVISNAGRISELAAEDVTVEIAYRLAEEAEAEEISERFADLPDVMGNDLENLIHLTFPYLEAFGEEASLMDLLSETAKKEVLDYITSKAKPRPARAA